MTAYIRNMFVASLWSVALGSLMPAPARGDDYWDGHWQWYDNTYRPYYSRQYISPSPYGYTYGNSVYSYPGYANPGAYGGVGVYGGPGVYVGPGVYGGPYYGTARAGYGPYGPYGGQVRVGPVQFGWR